MHPNHHVERNPAQLPPNKITQSRAHITNMLTLKILHAELGLSHVEKSALRVRISLLSKNE